MANERCTIAIFEQLEPRVSMPFRLVETMITTDGYRSRICNGAWASRDEAEADRQRRIKIRSS
jgi:hypothetical protein